MRRSNLAAGFALLVGAFAPLALSGATVTIIPGDKAGVGFNDAAPVSPIGGNTGVTLGQQRLIAFQTAAAKWAATLGSSVPIRISAVWTPLTCTANSAVLGSAGATEAFRDFQGAPAGGHWYAKALANKLAGVDLDPAAVDISANFNVNVGLTGCLTGASFYLGLDANHGSKVDLVAVVIHELGHGLGFQTFTDGQTGAQLGGLPSIWDNFLLDNTTNKTWTMMTNAERAASAVKTGHLVWNGGTVSAAIPQVLQAQGSSFSGADSSGRGLMYAPGSFQSGSSVSHYDTTMTRNQLMEPALSSDLTHEVTPPLDLTYPLLQDIGWTASTGQNPIPAISSITPNSTTAGAGAQISVQGSGFVNGSVVRWNGSDLATTFVSASSLQATVPAANTGTAAVASVTVFNPAPGGGTSGPVTFTVTNPLPRVTSLSPSSVPAGSAAVTMLVNGSGFVSGSTVQWKGANRSTTFVNAGQLSASIPASDLTVPGTAGVTVVNPSPGGGTSAAATFTIGANATYTISGQVTVSGAALSGVTMTLSGSQSRSTATDGSGNYSFTGLAAGGTYTVTPSRSGYTFTPPQTFTNLAGNQAASFAGTLISQIPSQPPSPVSSSPNAGSGTSHSFVFTFADPDGWQDLDVVNILISNYLDGRNGCYLAYSRSAGLLYLVNDPGTAILPGLALNGSGSTGNSQCTITAAGSAASGSGTSVSLTLNLSFSAGFAGNKVIFMAARDLEGGNSGWHALGTWNVPGPVIAGPSVSGMSPATSNSTAQNYTFTFTDTNGWQDIAVANILVNSSIDGRRACYVAIVPSSAAGASIFLVDDAGDAGGPYSGMTVPGSGSVSNSQCAIAAAGSSVSGSRTTLTVTLPMTFSEGFAGDRTFYLAARSNQLNSAWQPVGSITVP